MTKKLTLEELLIKEVDDILRQVTVENVVPEDIQKAKAGLKGFFKDKEDLIKTGYLFKLGDYDMGVDRVSKTSGRIFFRFKNNPRRFSLQIDYLLGKEQEFPYKKGDQVFFNDDIICTVIGVNKASQNVVIDVEGQTKKVAITRVRKFYETE
jgi:hypothetical protein